MSGPRQPDRLVVVAIDRRGRVIGRAESRATLAALLRGRRYKVAIQRGQAPSYGHEIHEGRAGPGPREVVTPGRQQEAQQALRRKEVPSG